MSAPPRIVDGWKVVEAEPGAPVPPGAERCELVETTEFSPGRRRWAIAAGVAGMVASLALKLYAGWGTALLLLSGGLVYRAAFANTRTVVTPSPTGRYLAFDAGIPHAESGSALADRFVLLVFGGVGLGAAGIVWFTGHSRIYAAALGAVGGVLLYSWLKAPVRDEPRWDPSSLRFHTLADPAYPLPDDALIARAPDAAADRGLPPGHAAERPPA